MHDHLTKLYPPEQARSLQEGLQNLATDFAAAHPDLAGQARGLTADQSEVLLIAYGDQVKPRSGSPLKGLLEFMNQRLSGLTGLHLLPHFPYSSDDGFSVIDYRRVNPILGSWEDVKALGERYNLMFDAVINHISAESHWNKEFLAGNDRGYLLQSDPGMDHSLVIRPRTHPLLTTVETPRGPKHVWTTFSADQIDLDYSNPDLLYEIADVLLLYAENGARYLRLDAVGFLWKELGTTCMHLPQTHELVKLLRTFFDIAAPGVCLVPEINGTYEENAPYFGNGSDEAQMVYNFPSPSAGGSLLSHRRRDRPERLALSAAQPSGRNNLLQLSVLSRRHRCPTGRQLADHRAGPSHDRKGPRPRRADQQPTGGGERDSLRDEHHFLRRPHRTRRAGGERHRQDAV